MRHYIRIRIRKKGTAQRRQAKAEGRKLVHRRRGPIDSLSFKRLRAFQLGLAR